MAKLKAKDAKKGMIEEEFLEEEEEQPAAGIGHNRKPKVGGVAADQLKSIIERIERLEEEKAAVASDIKDIFAEAKGNGYDVKTLKKVIAERKLDAAERDEREYLLETYKRALGMIADFEDEHGSES